MLGDLFTMLAGGAYVTKKCFDEIREDGKHTATKIAIDNFIKEHTDTLLEDRLRKDIENPDKHDEIYKRLEEYKQNNGRYALAFAKYDWFFVGRERFPLLDKYGNLYGKTQKETADLDANRVQILGMLMNTYDRMTYLQARNIASMIYIEKNIPDNIRKYILDK